MTQNKTIKLKKNMLKGMTRTEFYEGGLKSFYFSARRPECRLIMCSEGLTRSEHASQRFAEDRIDTRVVGSGEEIGKVVRNGANPSFHSNKVMFQRLSIFILNVNFSGLCKSEKDSLGKIRELQDKVFFLE